MNKRVEIRKKKSQRERERERERKRETHTDRQTDRQKEKTWWQEGNLQTYRYPPGERGAKANTIT